MQTLSGYGAELWKQHGHGKLDALSTPPMNAKFGGDQPIVRDTTIEREDGGLYTLDPHAGHQRRPLRVAFIQ